ncbi:tat pathway signal sequence [Cordyceps javanica]|uniref:Tat pathway signal sequence n=1 Tax=Cordyceps javanica TaxID=43265 RepID=A0A545W2I4_9HYPO|nr:tat pathway signal sequence [Cordyceps javanica]TQW08136.1 tat pathway signal sequence [Cordyceps javanica]
MPHRRHSGVDSSVSSRASLASIAHLPRLTETGELNRALPRVPLRVPQRNARRSLPPGGVSPGGGPVPYVSAGESPLASEPPTPTSLIPPPISPFTRTASEAGTGELHSVRGSVTQQKLADTEQEDEKEEWIDHRRRRCRFMILVGVFTAIVAALTIGLVIGLGKSNAKTDSQSSPDGSASAVFPAGAYSFETYLRENSTGCTSRASSWRCYPESGGTGSRAIFYWTVQAVGPRSYYVSGGTDEPFGPSFANLAATVLDADQPTERLTFAFAANKTVTPAEADATGGGGSRVARCTYAGTVLRATLWTRRRGGQPFRAPSRLSRNSPWPGDLEVVQYKNSTIGDPACVDKQGKGVADVQAAGGNCLCRYTSASLG